jgi:predicted O-linked N-acetylglucosamine transferase (SPINDLY family)
MYEDSILNHEALLNHVLNLVEQYRNEPANQSALAALRDARQHLARRWIGIPKERLECEYSGHLGKAHQTLLQSGLKYELLTDLEKRFLAREILSQLGQTLQEQTAIGYFLAAILYLYPHQIKADWPVNTAVPDWFLNDYLKSLLTSPNYFRIFGEHQRYFQFMQNTTDALHSLIFADPNLNLSQDLALRIAQQLNAIQLYFTQENLRDIQSKRGDIIEFSLRQQGAQIDYTFPGRSSSVHQKIRLGILLKACNPSPEIFLVLPIFEHLNRDLFEIVLFVFHLDGSQLEDYCRNLADRVIHIDDNNFERQAEIVRSADLDILFIGANITSATHQITILANYRLARVQLTNFASPITTGIRNVDYYIAGKLLEPTLDAQKSYREKLIAIEGTGFCFSYRFEPYTAQYQINREKLKISEDRVVFASTANLFKLVPELIKTWAKILAAVPNSTLMLMPFGPNWMRHYPGAAFMDDVRTIFAKYGMDGDRLRVLKAFPNRADVKEALKVSDIYLDSYPYAGTTSLIDALEAGIPSIAWEGDTLRSRMGAAILKSLSVTDLVANSEKLYIELAVSLAENPNLRTQKKQEILHKMQQKPAFLDGQAYIAQIQPILLSLCKS